MRVYVSSPSTAFGPQILAYAEYRLFAVLARYAGVSGVRVVLQEEPRGGVRCSVAIDVDSAAPVRASVKGRHAAGTIDRTAARVVELMRRRCQPATLAASN